VTPEDYRHRSPQVIYASDDDDDDGDLESGDGGDQELHSNSIGSDSLFIT